MGCKQSKDTYPRTKEEILAACVNGNVEYLQALVKNDRLVRKLGMSKVHKGSIEKRNRSDGFLTYRIKKESEQRADPEDKSSMVAQSRLDQVLWFDEAIAAAALADKGPVVTYLLSLDKPFECEETMKLILAGSDTDPIPYIIQVLRARAPTEVHSKFAWVLQHAVAENKPVLLAAVLKAEPEWNVPEGGLSLLAEARTLPVLKTLLADPRIDMNVEERERKVIAAIARDGSYEMLRWVLADPRVEFGPETAVAAFKDAARGGIDCAKKLRLIDQELPEERQNWKFYVLQFQRVCRWSDVETARWALSKLRERKFSDKSNFEKSFRGVVAHGASAAMRSDNALVLKMLLDTMAGGKYFNHGVPSGLYLLKKCCVLSTPSPSALKVLLGTQGIDPAADDNAAFIAACGAGNADAVKQLLADPRVNPRAQNSKGAKVASRLKHREVVRLILADSRANPGPTPEYGSGAGKGKEEIAPPPDYKGYDSASYSYSYYSEE